MANRKVSGFRAVINTMRVEIMAAVAKMAVRLLPTLSLKVRRMILEVLQVFGWKLVPTTKNGTKRPEA